MGYVVIAPVGDNLDALFVGMKEFAMERLYLIAPPSKRKEARELEKKMEMFAIPVHILEMQESLMSAMFYQFGQICSKHDHDDIIVNVATGDRLSSCAALSAAFANGLKAFGIMDGKPMLLPIMKLSYYNELTESKYKILKELKADNFTSLSELRKSTGMSVSLLSYHLNGTLKYKGLINLRLAEVKEKNKNLLVKLSQMGALLLRGNIDCAGKPCAPVE
jgi:predicted transcriptional regulator